MKTMNKKGFTLVELAIVIAVIAILAAIMIPTFGAIIEKAEKASAYQEAMNAYREAYALVLADDGVIADAGETVTAVEGWSFTFTKANGETHVTVNSCPAKYSSKYSFTWNNGEFAVADGTTPPTP